MPSVPLFLKESNMMAYLKMTTVQLLELHCFRKRKGGLFRHCDPTAHRYLKMLLNKVFGIENFINEISGSELAQ
jgi:adenine specific DNA methylase Mod